jgi:alanine-glyoxylate transaminase/serine-glyoxylate transaminase/serine-pyruvate transaminase
VNPEQVFDRLSADPGHAIKAVTVVHNETSTGAMSRIPQIHEAIDAAVHPALLIVDTISSLGSVDYRHDEWGVDVTVWCSQKGMMLPPGLGLNAVSAKALTASREAGLPRSYWAWQPLLGAAETGLFPYTPPTNLLYGLRESLAMFAEEGLTAVFARHARHAEATRRAVRAWGLDIVCANPAEYSRTLTAVLLPDGHDADRVRAIVLDRYNASLGAGLGKLAGRAFRIGHLGDLGDLMLAGTLCGVEMGLAQAGVPIARAGVRAALDCLEQP